ncbi:hypothetical protein V3C99_009652 [Haemonchus contortus]
MMVLERLIAMFRKDNHEKSNRLVGPTFVIAVIASSVFMASWTFRPEIYSNYYVYCSSGSIQTISRLVKINISLCVICAISMIGTLLLKIYNNGALQRRTYKLSESFYLRENKRIIQLLYPLSIFQTSFIGYHISHYF